MICESGRAIGALSVAICLIAGPAAAATAYMSDLMFRTDTRQSAWGPGPAQRVEDSIFLGGTWTNQSATLGGISGSIVNRTVPNPAFGEWLLCTGATFGFGDCGSRPSETVVVQVDERTGAQVSLTTSGRAGIEVGYLFDAGSVGAEVGFKAQAELPQAVRRGDFFALNPQDSLVSGALDAQSPTANASLDVVMDVDLSANGLACAFLLGCASASGKVIDVDSQAELIGIDPNRIAFGAGLFPPDVSLELPLANVEASLQVDITGRPSVDVGGLFTIGSPPVGVAVELANAEFQVPNVQATGGLADGKLTASGLDQIVGVNADLDTLVPLVPTGGASFGVGSIGITLEAFDIEAGPRMSLLQEFSLIPELMVDLAFDRPVLVEGLGEVMGFSGAWESLPQMAVLGPTTFSPTFWLNATLDSLTALQFGLELTIELAKAEIGFGPLTGTLGPLVDLSFPFNPDFARISLFDDSFAFEGFNRIAAAPFLVAPVPLPAPAALLLAGLAALALARRRRA